MDLIIKIPQEFRKFGRNCHTLKQILNDTRSILEEIIAADIFPAESICQQALIATECKELSDILNCHPALIVLGQNCTAKALLVNALLGEKLLPPEGVRWRWIRILYSPISCLAVVLGLNFKEGETLEVHNKAFVTVPEEVLTRTADEMLTTQQVKLVEVKLNHPVLRDSMEIIVPPDQDISDPDSTTYLESVNEGFKRILPVFLFALGEEALSDENIQELRKLKEIYPDVPVCFICTSTGESKANKELQQHLHLFCPSLKPDQTIVKEHISVPSVYGPCTFLHQLASLGYLHLEESKEHSNTDECSVTTEPCCGQFKISSDYLDNVNKINQLVPFVRGCLQSYLIKAANFLNEIQSKCLRQFILSAFDMAREIQITPRRIQYAQDKELELYKNLMLVANEKQEEIRHLIQSTLQEMRSGLVEKAADYQYHGVTLAEGEEVASPQEVRIATSEIHYLVLSRLSNAVAAQLSMSVNCLQDTYVGTLQRCLDSLEKNFYEQEGNLLASDAVKQILNAAYNVELTTSTSSNLLHSFMERLRKLLHSFQLPWSTPPRLDTSWRRRVATEMLDSLSSTRLARSISAQFRERVRASHESFSAAVQALENHYCGHLERTEEQRVAIRKRHAPKLARLALESTSLCDMVLYGVPELGREIGRGHYGVVFACDSWGGQGPFAVKSVIPPDEKHWNDLAMEFYYTRTIPEHKRIVRLRGSVVDNTYGGGCTPSVLLVMDRHNQDLYCGLRTGLKWLIRLQIATDVVEGIRYLHSQGLVHRDIKLKNVLLDSENRAKITDLGFCIPEAMMSGSIVGTPVHMAPELLSGHYDSSVDVYAFGIMFWYICGDRVRLPYVFEQFQNKEQLWLGVRKGLRPEKLPHFDDTCWNLMEECWAGEPSKRPLLGCVLPLLESIKNHYMSKDSSRVEEDN